MKTSAFLSTIVLSFLGVSTAAQAESYDGVISIESVRPRAEVAAEARAAAHAPVFGESSYADMQAVPVNQASRLAVRRGAEEIARAGNPYGDAASAGVLSVQGARVDSSNLRAEAREATH